MKNKKIKKVSKRDAEKLKQKIENDKFNFKTNAQKIEIYKKAINTYPQDHSEVKKMKLIIKEYEND